MLDLKPAEASGSPQSLHPKSLRGTKLPIKPVAVVFVSAFVISTLSQKGDWNTRQQVLLTDLKSFMIETGNF